MHPKLFFETHLGSLPNMTSATAKIFTTNQCQTLGKEQKLQNINFYSSCVKPYRWVYYYNNNQIVEIVVVVERSYRVDLSSTSVV